MKGDMSYEDFAGKLTGDYAKSYEQIRTYFLTCCFDVKTRDACLNDVVELLLSAQNNGTSARKIVGEDVEAFCRETLRAVRPSWGRSLWAVAVITACIALFMAMAVGYFYLAGRLCYGAEYRMEMTGSALLVVTAVLAGVVILMIVLQKWMQEYRKIRRTRQSNHDITMLMWWIFYLFSLRWMHHEFWPMSLQTALWGLLCVSVPVVILALTKYPVKAVWEMVLLRRSRNGRWDSCVDTLRTFVYVRDPHMEAEERVAYVHTCLRRRTIIPWVIIGLTLGLVAAGAVRALTTGDRYLLFKVMRAFFAVGMIDAILVEFVLRWRRFRREFEALGADIQDESLLRLEPEV